MFYVMLLTKKGKWKKTCYGAPDDSWSVESFKGMALKINADHALIEARTDNPNETYRLIYSEEEL